MASARVMLELPAAPLGAGEEFDVLFCFDPEDPCAVTLEVADGCWIVDRSLLARSLLERCGEGLVHIEPLSGFPQRLSFSLSGPAAPVPFAVPTAPVWEFLTQVWRTVPEGEELALVDFEEELRRLSGPAA